ncbi:uncharacterized protein [Engystomops pustulosus]|uniref:uncharacterized protein n=1 Tax=Engystomops pustulosus TaxID=76066 RepID=UPI003AFAB5ED
MDAQRWLLIINLFISAVGDAEIETYKTDRRLGSFVLFPGLKKGTKFKANMIYELRKVGASPGWLMMDHGAPKVHKFYERRGTFFKENKSFLLTNLTKEDSGVYEQKLNQKTLLRVYLTVMDPVQRPVLRRQDDNETCRVTLRCDGWERDSANLTFQRNGVELPRNTSLDEDLLVIDGNDPQQWGSYTCTRTNLVSLEVSQKLVLEPEGETHYMAALFVYSLYPTFSGDQK